MHLVTLGKTGITVNKNGFGALPIQRVSKEDAAVILKKAFQNGIDFYDTARAYTDSEEKIGYALSDVRDKIYLATKTMATNADKFREDLKLSLELLKTDYIDIYQFHNPKTCPKPGDGSGLYEAMLEAKEKGLIRHIGLTNHRVEVAVEAAESGLYETVQYPFGYLASEKEIGLVRLCRERSVGFIAMKALAGGLLTNSAAAYAYLAQYDNVLPIWGIQKEKELDEFIFYITSPPVMNEEYRTIINSDRQALLDDYCRGCGYCLPCPADIEIPLAARMTLLLKRAPHVTFLSPEWKEKMRKIENCIHCDHCKDHCPYGLDTPRLLAENWAAYQEFL